MSTTAPPRWKIASVVIELSYDPYPDFSDLGEYTSDWGPGCINCATDEFYDHIETLAELIVDEEERDAFLYDAIPATNHRSHTCFRPYAGGEPPGTPDFYTAGRQDYERMEAYERNEWSYQCVSVRITFEDEDGDEEEVETSCLGGVESDSGDAYFRELAADRVHDSAQDIKEYAPVEDVVALLATAKIEFV